MSDNYYKLLGLERDVPHWKFAPRVYEVADEAVQVYGSHEAVPAILQVAITTLGTEEERARYDSFLEWSQAGSELDPGQLGDEAIHYATAIHHFALEKLPNGNVKLLLQSVPSPPPPPPRESSSPQSEPASSNASSPKQPPVPDAFGRVNGEPPPLALGNRTFTYHFGWLRLVHAQIITEKRPRKRTYVKAQWQHAGDGSEFAEDNYLGWNASKEFWQPGHNYHALWLKETVSGEHFRCCYCYENPQGTKLSITHIFDGLFRVFYHQIDHRKFEQLYPGYRLPYDYFGTGGTTTPESMEIAVRYLRETSYWVIQSMFGKYVPEEARNLANLATGDSIRAWNYPARALRKLGVPVT